jgi:hypothetical protein
MIAAFTVCSNNYIAQAVTLFESLKKSTPDWHVFIGLVDAASNLPSGVVPDWIRIVPIKEMPIEAFDRMMSRYNIIELCTAIKPSCFRYIFGLNEDFDQVHYLDPDTCVFSTLDVLAESLSDASVLLTPHHLTPIPLDGLFPAENLALNHGIYNLGYLGLKRSRVSDDLLDWWEDLMRNYCIIDLKEGWFVDQLPFNYVPIYFDSVKILRHPGVNVAYWNFHERLLVGRNEIVFQDRKWPLVLFHFSGFSPATRQRPTRADVRLDTRSQPALSRLLDGYANAVLGNRFEELRKIPPAYCRPTPTDSQTLVTRARRASSSLKSALARRFVGGH